MTIETFSLPGVAPLDGDTCSQLPPLLVVTDALYEIAVPFELVSPNDVLGVEPGV